MVALPGWKVRQLPVAFLGLLIALGSASAAPAAQGAGQPCGCDDVADLMNRINMAHAAIETYQTELPAIRAGGSVTVDGTAPGGSATNYDILQNSAKAAQIAVQDAAARTGSADTSGVTCKPRIHAPTPCLESLLALHESLHVNECEIEKKRRSLGYLDDRMKGKPLVDMVNEEIKGYQIEIGEALQRLRAMPATCRPTGWTGTITATEAKRLSVTTTSPPQAQYSNGSTLTATENISRFGRILYRGDHSTASWNTQQISSRHEESSMRVSCTGGLKPTPPDRTESSIVHSEVNGSGTSTTVPSVSLEVTPDGLYYSLSFRIPEVRGQLSQSGFNKTSGGCSDGEIPVPAGIIPSTISESDPLEIAGSKAPNEAYISGSKVIDMMPFQVTIPGVTENSHKVEVKWHLHEIP